MKIREGAYYRTRGGYVVVGPLIRMTWCKRTFGAGNLTWREDGSYVPGDVHDMDLISEVYVSDTPPAFMRLAATPSDDTVISFNVSEMARDNNSWATGDIGFWIGDDMRMARYDVRIEGKESNAWPSDVPNPWRDKRGLPAPAPETKTLRDEFAMEALPISYDYIRIGKATSAFSRYALAATAYDFADAMMEARKK